MARMIRSLACWTGSYPFTELDPAKLFTARRWMDAFGHGYDRDTHPGNHLPLHLIGHVDRMVVASLILKGRLDAIANGLHQFVVDYLSIRRKQLDAQDLTGRAYINDCEPLLSVSNSDRYCLGNEIRAWRRSKVTVECM